MKKIKFRCSLAKIATDGEGYSKVTFEVPSSDIAAIVGLTMMTGRCLLAQVMPVGDNDERMAAEDGQ